MGFWNAVKNFFLPKEPLQATVEKPQRPRRRGTERKVMPGVVKDENMAQHADRRDDDNYSEPYSSYPPGRDLMGPEMVKSFNEFSQLLHNINIKMASQNDQNMALLRSLESLPAIIKDIPRARELEGDVLQEILILLKDTRTDKVKVADRLNDVKTAMMAMEENSKAQISFFEGKERAHREQMTMMREFIEREKKHHRNNLTGVLFMVLMFIAMLCTGAFLFLREKFNALEQELRARQTAVPAAAVPAPERIFIPYPAEMREHPAAAVAPVPEPALKNSRNGEEKPAGGTVGVPAGDVPDTSGEPEERNARPTEVPFE